MHSHYMDNIFDFSPQGDENYRVFKLPTRQKKYESLDMGLRKQITGVD